MDLFEHSAAERVRKEQPLAARMRPRTLDEFVGQEHILAPGRLLRRAIQADQLSSVIFYGPPGTGKTTLAMVIANTTRSHFETLNAVLAGVKDVRRVTEEAQRRRSLHGRRTILFVDEVHRWNKAQQDALLPWVENGTVILIGATTENPYFEVNRALVSRSRIFQLKPLEARHLREIARRALEDPERGYGRLKVEVHPEALEHMVNVANGDARALLNALELAVETTLPNEDGVIVVDMAVAEESIQRRAVLYDKEGDYHFDTISAYIKSMRGSDPDAALYWLARMVYAGEDPRFIFRRMLIFACEDVGLADPNALVVVEAAASAFDRVGMPEGNYHLGFATLYLATAPKSNSVMAFFDALRTVENEREDEVPTHLKDASRDSKGFGHGQGYLYPHAYREHWAPQQYLPDSLQGRTFYRPGRIGYEKGVAEVLERRREALLAAALDPGFRAPAEVLTWSPDDRAFDRWLARTTGNAGELAAGVRDRLFTDPPCPRHAVVLDLSGDSGLLTWEAVRRACEGGVWTLTSTPEAAEALRVQAAEHCPDLRAPYILTGRIEDLPQILAEGGFADVRFDRIVGRGVLEGRRDRFGIFSVLRPLLREEGVLLLAESIPRHTQRLYRLLPPGSLPPDLMERWTEAEEAMYRSEDEPLVNWDASDLERALRKAGFEKVGVETERVTLRQVISPERIARWFDLSGDGGRGGYAARLRSRLSDDEIARIRREFERRLAGQNVQWEIRMAWVRAHACR